MKEGIDQLPGLKKDAAILQAITERKLTIVEFLLNLDPPADLTLTGVTS